MGPLTQETVNKLLRGRRRHSQHDGRDGEELPGSCELDPVVHLLPVGQEAGLTLVRRLERRPLDRVQQQVHALQTDPQSSFTHVLYHISKLPPPRVVAHQVVDQVGEGPDHGNADHGDAEQDDVEQPDAQDVGQPHAPAVHHPGVGVDLAVRRAHVHVQHLLPTPPPHRTRRFKAFLSAPPPG